MCVLLLVTLTQAQALAGTCAKRADQQPAPQITELKFSDFYQMPIGPAGLTPTETLMRAQGKRICIMGYMVKRESPSAGQIMLTPVPVEMSEHADGEADDLPATTVTVLLSPSQRTWRVPQASGLVAITGLLHVGRHESEDGRISWIQLELTEPLPTSIF